MRYLNAYLGTSITTLLSVVVTLAIIKSWSDPNGAEHLVELAKAIFSLPLFASATIVWLGGNYKDEIRTLVSRRRDEP